MKLIPVDGNDERHLKLLWALLKDRPLRSRVSHKRMPTWDEHVEFVLNHPYKDWCLISIDAGNNEDLLIGSVFISQPARPSVIGDELSVDINVLWRGGGRARQALELMMQKHPRRRYLANVGTENYASMALFQSLGFKLCQFTFELEVAE